MSDFKQLTVKPQDCQCRKYVGMHKSAEEMMTLGTFKPLGVFLIVHDT